MNMPGEPTDPRSAWGRARFGGGGIPAVAVAIPLGLLISAGCGALVARLSSAEVGPLAVGLIYASMTLGPAIALVYALVVDRGSVRGVVRRPEESIEQAWYQQATSGALTDVLLVAGVALFALSFVPNYTPDARISLMAVILTAAVSTGIRFAILRRRG